MPAPRSATQYGGRNVGRGQREQFKVDTSATAWMAEGKCAGSPDPDLWFRGFDGDGAVPMEDRTNNETATRRARKICAGCPISSAKCAGFALNNNLTSGVFGGMTPGGRERNRSAIYAALGLESAS